MNLCKRLIWHILMLLFCASTMAQTSDYRMRTEYYDGISIMKGHSVLQLDDGGFLLAGAREDLTFSSRNESFLLRVNEKAEIIWFNTYKSYWSAESNPEKRLKVFVEQIDEGSFLVCSPGDNPNEKTIIFKVDTAGTRVWARSYDLNKVTSFKKLQDGTYAMACEEEVVTIDDNGIVVNTLRLSLFPLRPKQVEEIDGDLLLFYDSGPGPVVVRTSPEGNIVWSKSYEGVEEVQACLTLPDGFVMACGISLPEHAVIVKCDKQGNIEWSKHISLNKYTQVNSIVRHYYGDLSFTVRTGSDSITASRGIVVRLDKNGNAVFGKQIGENYVAEDHMLSAKGDLVFWGLPANLLKIGPHLNYNCVISDITNYLQQHTVTQTDYDTQINPTSVSSSTPLFVSGQYRMLNENAICDAQLVNMPEKSMSNVVFSVQNQQVKISGLKGFDELYVFSATGSVVGKHHISENSKMLPLPATGVYIIHLQNEHSTFQKKVLVF